MTSYAARRATRLACWRRPVTSAGLEPAIALPASLLLLRQVPGMASAAGIIFVVIAGIGATRVGAPTRAARRHDRERGCQRWARRFTLTVP